MNEATQAYIKKHEGEDVRQLALSPVPAGVCLREALTQIEGRQLAARKAPTVAAEEGILFPPRLNIEQCSSEPAAMYKRAVVDKLYFDYWHKHGYPEDMHPIFCDLTGGFGIDFMSIAALFQYPTMVQRAIYVEQDADLCALARHNFPLWGSPRAEVVCARAEEVLKDDSFFMPSQFVCLYIDPSRRDAAGRKVALIEDCRPDVCALQEQLRRRAHYTLIKLSPMLDLTAALRALQGIEAVHVVSVAGECKELLLVMGRGKSRGDRVPVHCVDLAAPRLHLPWFEVVTSKLKFTLAREKALARAPLPAPPAGGRAKGEERGKGQEAGDKESTALPPVLPPTGADREGLRTGVFLYEPNASILKAGAFKTVGHRFHVEKLSLDAHLYTSERLLRKFPGRCWRVLDAGTLGKKDLKRLLASIEGAELSVRGFPMSVSALRRQLRLKEGGDAHFIATTVGGQKMLLRVERV